MRAPPANLRECGWPTLARLPRGRRAWQYLGMRLLGVASDRPELSRRSEWTNEECAWVKAEWRRRQRRAFFGWLILVGLLVLLVLAPDWLVGPVRRDEVTSNPLYMLAAIVLFVGALVHQIRIWRCPVCGQAPVIYGRKESLFPSECRCCRAPLR